MRRALLLLALAACGNDMRLTDGPDAEVIVDAPPDAFPGLPRSATGTHLVEGQAVVGGLTLGGDVAYFDYAPTGEGVAKIIPLAGGEPIEIARSVGTGKQDVRFAVSGNTVLAWTDRGNRMATLTAWSRAGGVKAIGGGIRPGRAAVSADGATMLYEQNISAETADIVAGPVGGVATLVASTNSADNDCWMDTDLVTVGDRFVVRACLAGSSAFALQSVPVTGGAPTMLAASALDASYTADRIVWLDGDGLLWSAHADGSARVRLGVEIVDYTLSPDQQAVAYFARGGTIAVVPIDGTRAPDVRLTPDRGAVALGALAPDHHTVLYATQLDDHGPGFVQPDADVWSSDTGPVVQNATSCPWCLSSTFSADSTLALVIDPIDNSELFDAEGPIRVVSLATNTTVATFGALIYQAIAITNTPRFLFIASARSTAFLGGWSYAITSRTLDASDHEQTLGSGIENFVINKARTVALFSLPPADDGLGGIWLVTPLGLEPKFSP